MGNTPTTTNQEGKKAVTSLVPTIIEDKRLGRSVLNLMALEPSVRKEIKSITIDIQSEFQKAFTSFMKIGQLLSRAKEVLKEERMFVVFLNGIPGFSRATAYRYLAAYESGQKLLPKPILERALSRGVDIISYSKDRPFGKYSDYVKKHTPPKNPTDAEAEQWLNEVVTSGGKKGKGKGKTPEALQAMLVRILYKAFRRQLSPQHQKVAWLTETVGYALDLIGFNVKLEIQPKKYPSSWDDRYQFSTIKGKVKKEKEEEETEAVNE